MTTVDRADIAVIASKSKTVGKTAVFTNGSLKYYKDNT